MGSVLLMMALIATAAAAESATDLLTPAERAWLNDHPNIVLGVGADWPPWVMAENEGEVTGLAADHLELLNRKLDTHIRLKAGPWHAMVEQAEARALDGLTLSAPLAERRAHFLFTDSFYTAQYFVYLRDGETLPEQGLDGLSDKRIGYLRKVLRTKQGLSAYPAIEAVPMESQAELAEALLTGRLDAVVAGFALEYWRSSQGLVGFGPKRMLPGWGTPIVISVRADWPELAGILNKGLAAITTAETAALQRRWLGHDYLHHLQASRAELSAEQRGWLAAHPDLVAGFPREQPPAVVIDGDGQATGVFVDFLDLLNERLGTPIRVELDTWPRLVARAERREIDMLGLTFPLEAHRAHFDFTTPFFKTYYYLYARSDDTNPPTDLASLSGKRVGYVAATRIVEQTLGGRADVTLVALPSQEALATALIAGDVDVVLASISLEYWRKQHTQTGFRVAGLVPEVGGDLVMSVRNDWPELTTILNAGLAAITGPERQAILGRWLGNDLPSAPSPGSSTLDAEERAWLAAHPIVRVGIDPSWAPVSFVDERGAPQGIAVAYLYRLQERLGVGFELLEMPSWSAAKLQFTNGGLDVLPAIASTPARQEAFLMTEPYVTFPAAIFSAAAVAYLGGADALRGKEVTVIRGDAVQEWLRQREPEIRLLPVADTREGLERVARGEAFAFVGNLVTTSYYIGQSGLAQIKVAGETSFNYRLSMAVGLNRPVLASILQKGLDAISTSERDAIYHDWISIRYARETDWTTVWRVLVIAGLLLAVIAMWNLSLTREIARRRHAEAALREAKDAAEQADRAKTAFLGNISHELRTPLNVVLGFTSMLHGSARSSRERGWLESIQSAGKSLAQLIDDLLDLSRIEAGRVRPRPAATDIRALLHELESMFRHRAIEKGLALDVHVEDSVPDLLLLDDKRVRQILINLLGNAVKFTDAGRIELGAAAEPTEPTEPGRIRLNLSVADTGPGIAAADRERIFESFTQGVEDGLAEGAGLGLAISRRLAGILGGNIALQSEPGAGSTFVLELPDVVPLPTRLADPSFGSGEPAPRFAPARVLIVDDRADNRGLLRQFLADEPFEILEARDGYEALAIARDQRPQLILMDIAMPGLDGVEAARHLRASTATAEIPILGVTAAAGREEESRLGQVFERVLHKPLTRAALLAALGRWLPTQDSFEARAARPGPLCDGDGSAPLVIPAVLHRRLSRLHPPFSSINEIEQVAEALLRDATERGDAAAQRAARRLLEAAEQFDLAELTQQLDNLKGRTARAEAPDSHSWRAEPT